MSVALQDLRNAVSTRARAHFSAAGTCGSRSPRAQVCCRDAGELSITAHTRARELVSGLEEGGGGLTVDVTDRCSETQQVCGFIIITFIQTASCSGQEHQQENPGVLRDVLLLLLPELLLSWSCFRLPRAGWTS